MLNARVAVLKRFVRVVMREAVLSSNTLHFQCVPAMVADSPMIETRIASIIAHVPCGIAKWWVDAQEPRILLWALLGVAKPLVK